MQSSKEKIYGERFILNGDAASLIDTFLGEGIANAIRSGRYAAEHIISAFEVKGFSKRFNKKYHKKIYSLLKKEIIINSTITKLFSANFFVKTFFNSVEKIPFLTRNYK